MGYEACFRNGSAVMPVCFLHNRLWAVREPGGCVCSCPIGQTGFGNFSRDGRTGNGRAGRNTGPMAEQGQTEQSKAAENTEPASQEQTEYLEAIPAAYFENSAHSGQVVQVTYESRDYTGDDTAITKPAFVYLPYGYDESDTDTRYDILYLMYGWTMTADDFLGEGRSNLVNILDNTIASGDIPPVIVVSTTFDAEDQPQSFSRSVEELSVFHNDLRENLMPYIENRFHTYAEDVTEEGFEASREHWAFGGFSLGAVTTWY